MSRTRSLSNFILAAFAIVASALPPSAVACAVCYGQSDSPMAVGMNWGIFSLLAIITAVLATVAGFFIFLARKSALVHAVGAPRQQVRACEVESMPDRLPSTTTN